jgi:tetratricopeptide (TPR) repeat protein
MRLLASVVLPALLSPPGALPAHAESSPSAQAVYETGAAALRAGRHAEAAAALEQAVRLDPRRGDAWAKLGAARSSLMDYSGAITAYGKAAELDPGNAKAWHNVGNAHFRRGDYGEAARLYGKAVELDPHYVLGRFHHGWTLRELNRVEEAERAFRACLEIPPRDDRERKTRVDCLFGLGSLRHRAGDYAASAAAMEQVLTAHPGHPEARHYLAMAYRHLGRLEEAEREMTRYQKMMAARRDSTALIERPEEP